MRVLLREPKSGLFYAGFNQFAYEAEQARDFGRVENADEFLAKEKVAGFEVVVLHEDRRKSRIVPVTRASKKPAA